MGLFGEVELIIPPGKQNTKNKTIKVKSLNGYDAIGEKLVEGNTVTVHASAMQHQPAESVTKPKNKVGIGL